MTQTQILHYYREIIQHPTLILELSEYQRSKIQEFAKREWSKAQSEINDIMLANPNYEYPDNLNGNYIDYWSEQLNAKDAKRVLSALETYGNSDSQEMTMKKTDVPVGKVLAEVEIANPSDPAKFQRSLISLIKQYQSTTGTTPIFKHPFFWHTKHEHNSISPYTLVVNKDEVSTDETGRVIDTNVVQLTEADINQSFVEFILSCHINQIAPFLTFQFEKYYNSLLANESAQPFFDYVIELIDSINQHGRLYKAEKDALFNWIITNPHYNPKTLEPTKDISIQNVADVTEQKVLEKQSLVHRIAPQGNSIKLTSSYTQLFNTETEAISCLRLMQRWNLIDASYKNKIGQRQKYRLMAFVEALQQKCLLPPGQTASSITMTIAEQIQMPYKRARNGDRKNYDEVSRNFLSKLNTISTGLLTWSIVVDSGR